MLLLQWGWWRPCEFTRISCLSTWPLKPHISCYIGLLVKARLCAISYLLMYQYWRQVKIGLMWQNSGCLIALLW